MLLAPPGDSSPKAFLPSCVVKGFDSKQRVSLPGVYQEESQQRIQPEYQILLLSFNLNFQCLGRMDKDYFVA